MQIPLVHSHFEGKHKRFKNIMYVEKRPVQLPLNEKKIIKRCNTVQTVINTLIQRSKGVFEVPKVIVIRPDITEEEREKRIKKLAETISTLLGRKIEIVKKT